MRVVLEIIGSDAPAADLESLGRSLRSDDELRTVEIESRVVGPAADSMGAVTEALVVAFGSGGVGVAIIQAISAWLRAHRSDVRVKISSGECVIEIDLKSIDDPAQAAALIKALQPPGRDLTR